METNDLHQVGQRTFTSKLLTMPSTQRSRFAAGRYHWSKSGIARSSNESELEAVRGIHTSLKPACRSFISIR